MIPRYNPTGLRCEKPLTAKTVCGKPAHGFAKGRNWCAAHDPKGAPNCPHSMIGYDRCTFCGARIPQAVTRGTLFDE